MGLRKNAATINAYRTAQATSSVPALLKQLVAEQQETNRLLQSLLERTAAQPPRL